MRKKQRGLIPTLKTISLRTRPLNIQALAWSSDAELVVGADESIHVFLPEFSVAQSQQENQGEPPAAGANAAVSREQFFSTKIRIPIPPSINPRINAHIASVAQPAEGSHSAKATPSETSRTSRSAKNTRLRTVSENDDDEYDDAEDDAAGGQYDAGYGAGQATGFGGSLNQVVALAWSPPGLGVNGRPVLSAVLTCGSVLIYGEAGPDQPQTATGAAEAQTTVTIRERSFERWRILWGIGGPLPGVGWRDRVKAWSWSKEVGWGRALVVYATDTDQLVVMAVERRGEGLADWKVKEVASFHGAGPHEKVDINDPDYVPSASPFGLRWSPWVQDADGMTATIGYLAPNYIGFRRLTISSWAEGEDPVVKIAQADSEGLCLHLGTDAFFEWEDTPFQDGDSLVCRGIIATPLYAKPFQATLTGNQEATMPLHKVSDCGTTYPEQGKAEKASQNPITGLIIHSSGSPTVQYTLVRLSATASTSWLQSNVSTVPQWASEIERLVSLRLPPSMAYKGALSDSENDGSASSSAGSDSDDSDDLDIDADAQVHPNRVRIWALAASPARGTTAVLFSRYVTMFPDRPQRSKVAFGWIPMDAGHAVGDSAEDAMNASVAQPTAHQASAESRAWEWMYGGGPPVVGVSQPLYMHAPTPSDGGIKGLFADLVGQHQCVFCDGGLRWQVGGYYECAKGHSFAGCTVSGLPILSPGISRICGLCKRRCITRDEIMRRLAEHCGKNTDVPELSLVCGACGGKFLQ
ncbi:hypothetical protein BROUX41_005868 [Berkeleyomyces rouxiae]